MKPIDPTTKDMLDRTDFQQVNHSSKLNDALANLFNLVTVTGALCAPAVILRVWIWGWPW